MLGHMLALPDLIGDVATVLVSEDFYDPTNAAAFAELVDAWQRGDQLDGMGLVEALRRQGINPTSTWIFDVAAAGNGAWGKSADIIIDRRLRRDVLIAAAEATAAAKDLRQDPADVVGVLAKRAETALTPRSDVGADAWDADEFAAEGTHAQPPWVVPGLFRRGWRCVLIGPEGHGKSVIGRQCAYLAAKGCHPFSFEGFGPVPTLVLDAENPADAIAPTFIRMREALGGRWHPGGCTILHRPDGCDLRSRAERIRFEARLRAAQPQLVVLGPAYKLYRRRGSETDEDAVADVQAVLDDLRTRHGFALMVEHHQPNEAPGTRRPGRPHGSALWRRWPEIGLRLEPDDRGRVRLERFRGDRIVNAWPERLDRGLMFPWEGYWSNPEARRIPA